MSLAGSIAGDLGGSLAGALGPEGDASVAARIAAILGDNLVEVWDGQLGIALVSGKADTWTGQHAGIVMQAPGASTRPAYGADGSYFRGRGVVQTDAASSSRMSATLPSGTAPAGSNPYLLYVFRDHDAFTGHGLVLLDSGSGRLVDYHGSGLFQGQQYDGSNHIATVARDTSPHAYEFYADTGTMTLRLDGTVHTGAATGGISTEANQLGISLGAANQSVAAVILASAKPSTTEQDELVAWARSRWGTP